MTIVSVKSWWLERWQAGAKAGSLRVHPKAFFSLWHQRIILTVRYFFRLPIDDVKDQNLKSLANSMMNLAQQNVQLLQLVNSLGYRLAHYEKGPLRHSRAEYDLMLESGILGSEKANPNDRRIHIVGGHNGKVKS